MERKAVLCHLLLTKARIDVGGSRPEEGIVRPDFHIQVDVEVVAAVKTAVVVEAHALDCCRDPLSKAALLFLSRAPITVVSF